MWKPIEKNSHRKAHGKLWHEVPCVSLAKTCLSFNAPFLQQYCNGQSKTIGLYCFVDTERKAIGFKVASQQQIDSEDGWFVIRKTTKRTETRQMTLPPRIRDAFKDCLNRTYRAYLNPEERIIEVVLTPDNEIR